MRNRTGLVVEEPPRVHLQIGGLDEQIIVRAGVVHIAADRDAAGELARA